MAVGHRKQYRLCDRRDRLWVMSHSYSPLSHAFTSVALIQENAVIVIMTMRALIAVAAATIERTVIKH